MAGHRRDDGLGTEDIRVDAGWASAFRACGLYPDARRGASGAGAELLATIADVTLGRDGREIGTLHPEKRVYPVAQMPTTEAALDNGLPARHLRGDRRPAGRRRLGGAQLLQAARELDLGRLDPDGAGRADQPERPALPRCRGGAQGRSRRKGCRRNDAAGRAMPRSLRWCCACVWRCRLPRRRCSPTRCSTIRRWRRARARYPRAALPRLPQREHRRIERRLARDLRLLVRERLVEGDSNAEVVDYIVDRYGEYVLLKPRMSGGTGCCGARGRLMLLIALGGGFVYLRGRSPRPRAGARSPERDGEGAPARDSRRLTPRLPFSLPAGRLC